MTSRKKSKRVIPSPSAVRKAKKIHKKRPKKAREVDESLLSKLTASAEVYESDPARFDMIGVDTPKKLRLRDLLG